VPGAHDEDGPAREAVALGEHVGEAVGDAVSRLVLAGRGDPRRAERAGVPERSAGVDHGPCEQPLGPAFGPHDQLERRLGAADVLHLVRRPAGDRDDAMAGADAPGELGDGGQRQQVALTQLGAGRVRLGVRGVPAGPLEQPLGDRVDAEAPGGEEADVTPARHAGGDLRPGLEDDRLQPAIDEPDRRGEADGTGSDDGDGKAVRHDAPRGDRKILMTGRTVAEIREVIKISRYAVGMSTPLPVVACCAPLGAGPLSDEEALELEQVFKALADRHRVKILNRLLAAGGEAVCVCDFQELLAMKQSTVSYHLKLMLDAGIVTREKRGSYAYYGLAPGALEHLRDVLDLPTPAPAVAA
jgi:ArsR family transcriptional regulator